MGPRPPGLAHRVLGDEREVPRHRVRDPRRRPRPRLPASRERDRAVAVARPSVRAALDAQRDAPLPRREDAQVARQRHIRDALDTWGRETLLVFFLHGHWRKPIDYSDETLRRRRRAPTSLREVFRNPSEPAPEGEWERVRGRARRRLQHARGARDHALAGATTSCCAVRSTSSVSRRSPRARRRLRRCASSPSGGRRRARTATSRRGSASRGDRGGRLGRAGRGGRLPARAEAVTRDLVYGRRPVREALRGRRAALEVWASERALEPSRGSREAPVGLQVKPSASFRRPRHARPPGRARVGGALPLRRRMGARGARSARSSFASTG